MSIEKSIQKLQKEAVKYAFFFHRSGSDPVFVHNHMVFRSASIIKIPILLAWIELEKLGVVNREALCNLDAEPQVEGAGFSYLFHSRSITFHDVLLMMIATSDNLCTNLILREIGLEHLQTTMHHSLGLVNTRCERKLMDYTARERGLDNWVDAEECIRFYKLISALDQADRDWVKSLLAANTDDALFKRNLARDTVNFYHKTGSMSGVLHDWGFTENCKIFLLTQDVADEPAVFEVFGELGELLIPATDA